MKEIEQLLDKMNCPDKCKRMLVETLVISKYHRSDSNNKDIKNKIYSTLNGLIRDED